MANETVLFKRGDSATITSTPVTDGQILFDTSGNGKMYLDNGTDRLEMGGAITVDASLSKTSTNAIQNKAVTGNILNSLAEVSAATQQNTIAGALALKEVNSSLGDNILTYENGQYYIQNGDDTSTKKALGSATLPLVGLSYAGGYGMMYLSVSDVKNMSKFIIHSNNDSMWYLFTNTLSWITNNNYGTKITTGTEVDIKALADNSVYKYIVITTSAVGYGNEIPFTINM